MLKTAGKSEIFSKPIPPDSLKNLRLPKLAATLPPSLFPSLSCVWSPSSFSSSCVLLPLPLPLPLSRVFPSLVPSFYVIPLLMRPPMRSWNPSLVIPLRVEFPQEIPPMRSRTSPNLPLRSPLRSLPCSPFYKGIFPCDPMRSPVRSIEFLTL